MNRQRLLLILLFALLASIPFLMQGAGWISLFAFVPLLAYSDIAAEQGARHLWWRTFVAFLIFNIATTFWIWWISPVGAVTAIVLNTLQMNVIFGLYRSFSKKFSGALPYLFLIVLWIAWERFYQICEISWPWLILGNSFATSTHLVQWYEYTGFLGGSLWIWLSNILIYTLLRSIVRQPTITGVLQMRRRIAHCTAAIAVIAGPMILSACIYNRYAETDNPVEVVAVQPNIDAYTEKHGGMPQEVQDGILFELADSLVTPDTRYLITPETFSFSLNLDMPQDNCTFRAAKAYAAAHPGLSIILGSLTYRVYPTRAAASPAASKIGSAWFDRYNTAMLIDSGDRVTMYHKSKLVPGVEILPYEKYLKFLGGILEMFGGSAGSYARQRELSILHNAEGEGVGAMICYESIYGDYFRGCAQKGAGFVTVITNDGWWGDTPGYRQHFRYASLRAIENRRDIVHVANTGITGFIDQRGDVISRTGWWEPVALRGTVNLNEKKTFFTEHGDMIGRISTFLAALLLAAWAVSAITKKTK